MQAQEMEYAGALLEEMSQIDELSNAIQEVDGGVTTTYECTAILTIYCC